MKLRPLLNFLFAVVLFSSVAPLAIGQEQAPKQSKEATPAASTVAAPAVGSELKTTEKASPSGPTIHPLFIDIMKMRGLKPSGTTATANPSKSTGNAGIPSKAAEASRNTGPSNVAPFAFETQTGGKGANDEGVGQTLPLWTFRVRSSRDGNKYSGAMVGQSPFQNPGKTRVPTKVIPLIIKTQNVAVSFDPNTGIITTTPGETTFDPTQADVQNICLTAPNNVPTKLVKQSPIFTPTKFIFGGTNVGTTQYSDAFQRANFWNVLGKDRDDYHVLLDPEFLDPIVLEAPSVYGVAITNPLFFGPPASCGSLGIVDINWFDTYLTGTIIPSLEDVDPTNFPIFLVYNVVWASPANNLFTCCILGYHGTTGFPIPTQTYSPAEFDTTGNFSSSFAPIDTEVLSHEVDEWVNDPMVSNPTPPWGHTGQVGGCQANLEVGDPLSGTDMPAVTMPNGFTYHLQELAFFSWFFGTPSIGVNGWFSDNGTFLTDAGPPCH
jgi:hypothetical protein